MTRPASGTLIRGKYRVIEELGAGGFGIVLLARHEKLERNVALKLAHPDKLLDRDSTARLLSEARLAAKIRSEHVARVLDVDEDETGAPYIVLEHLHGKDLGAVVQSGGALPWETAVDHIVEACDAVLEAHTLGIVHRDLKPSNLFLERGTPSRIKVLDFGIAVELDRDRSEVRAGSPRYMAPEQLGRKQVDERTDVWGLGVTLYELLTGKSAFEGPDLERTLARVLNVTPPTPSSLVKGIPPELDAIVLRCLEKAPERRFGSVFSLLLALAELRPISSARILERARELQKQSGSDPVSSRRSPPSGVTTLFSQEVPPTSPEHALGSSTAALGHTFSARRPSRIVRGTLVLAALGAASFLIWRATLADSPMPVLAHGMISRSSEPSLPLPTTPATTGAASVPSARPPVVANRNRTAAPVQPAPSAKAPEKPAVASSSGVRAPLLEDRE